uniref:histidine kinase n=1 Tax=Magnetococcus massalia (strain MO-1) TaxID=451514 RepID=A0A1S7LHG5_MAGMO|nr:Conserved membrane protein of unknown function. Containing signal transduction response regulator, receiver region domain, ATP-binding region, ATPase-like domain and diguanylate cyclase domain [Candidatus Magnetococcus massalia]
MLMVRVLLLLLLLLSSALPLYAQSTAQQAGSSTLSSPTLTPITFQLRWKHQFQFAGYYAALERGYYREVGLDVTLRPGSPDQQPVSEVLAGRAHYGEANSELLQSRLLGQPLVALAAIFQHSPSVLLTRRDSGLSTPQDLLGRRVMMVGGSSDVEFLAMLRAEGVDQRKVELIPSSYEVDDLIYGGTDAFNAYQSNEPYYLKEQGIEINTINPRAYGIDFYSDILFTTEQELKQHPQRVEAFRAATLRGWRYALDNPGEIIELLKLRYGVKKSRAHLRYEAEVVSRLVKPEGVAIGHMNPGRWQSMAKQFVAHGLAAHTQMLDGFIYQGNQRLKPGYDEKGTPIVTVAVLKDFPPFYMVGRDGNPQGLAIDMMQAVAEETGVRVRYQLVANISEALESIAQGHADLIPGIGVSPERGRRFYFTRPMNLDRIACFVRSDDTITNLQGLVGKRVAAPRNSIAYARLLAMPGIEVVAVEGVEEGLLDLIIGKVDGFAVGEAIAHYKLQQAKLNARVKPLKQSLRPLQRAFMFHPELSTVDHELIHAYNNYLKSNRYTQDVARWLSGYSSSLFSLHQVLWGGALLLLVTILLMGGWHYRAILKMNRQLQKAHIEVSEAAAAKTLFLTTMSHEVRTPLNGIVGMMGQLKRMQMPPTIEHRFSMLSQSVESLNKLLTEVLDYSRIEANQIALEQLLFSPAPLFQEIHQGTLSLAEQRGLSLQLHLDSSLPGYLVGDPMRIRQIVANLLHHALAQTEEGSVSLSIHFSVMDKDKNGQGVANRGQLQIEIEDTSPGIELNHLPHLFDPFKLEGDLSVPQQEGQSLGLAISKQLIALMRGKMHVSSRVGEGSRYSFWLPVILSGDPGRERDKQPAAHPLAKLLQILIVEDDPISVDVVRDLIEQEGHQVFLASHGQEALQLSQQQTFDLILMDFRMPVMDGLTATKLIRQHSLNTTTPIVGLTADLLKDQVEEAQRLGMQSVLSKPVQVDPLQQLLQGLIEQ